MSQNGRFSQPADTSGTGYRNRQDHPRRNHRLTEPVLSYQNRQATSGGNRHSDHVAVRVAKRDMERLTEAVAMRPGSTQPIRAKLSRSSLRSPDPSVSLGGLPAVTALIGDRSWRATRSR